MIREYENELATLKMSLKQSKSQEARIRFAVEIDEIEEILCNLKASKMKKDSKKR